MLPNEILWNINWISSQKICALIVSVCLCVCIWVCGCGMGLRWACVCVWMWECVCLNSVFTKLSKRYHKKFDPWKSMDVDFSLWQQQPNKKILIMIKDTNCVIDHFSPYNNTIIYIIVASMQTTDIRTEPPKCVCITFHKR